MKRIPSIAVIAAACVTGLAPAEFTLYDSYDAWTSSATGYETITFNEIPLFSLVTTQYQDMGLTFVDLDGNWTDGTSLVTYPQDGVGLDGEQSIDIILSKEAFAIGAHFPGGLRYRLYSEGLLIYDSDIQGASQYNNFRGVVSSALSFDRVLLTDGDIADQVFLDNLYIAFVPVPGPAGVMVLGLAALCHGGRRRVSQPSRR